jgi:hypothetical protein
VTLNKYRRTAHILTSWKTLKPALARIAASTLMNPGAHRSRLRFGHQYFAPFLKTCGRIRAALACYKTDYPHSG